MASAVIGRLGPYLALLLATGGCDQILGLGHVPPYVPPDVAIDAPIQLGWKALTVGDAHSCGIRADDTLWCWGINDDHEVGIASTAGVIATPARVGAELFVQVSSTDEHTCAVTTSGELWCWGYNSNTQLGIGHDLREPLPVRLDATWKQVSAATTHTCGIQADDTLWCWGGNSSGQLGIGTNMQQPFPVQVGSARWLDVDAGVNHTCGVQTDHSLWCWGANSGAFGDGTTSPSNIPVAIAGEAWADISAGRTVTCGRTEAGALRCWGQGFYGSLGAGPAITISYTPVPVLVDGNEVEDWVQLSIEDQHGCGIRTDGSLWCWGVGFRAQLGTMPAAGYSSVPLQVTQGNTSWRRVATGGDHTCAIDVDNQLWCWGAGSRGQLGDPSTTRAVPARLADAFTQISAGGNVTCGIVAGTSAPVCAGYNVYGQLGDGTTTDRQVMTPLAASASDWSSISAGPSVSCGVRPGATQTWCWGYGTYGALGDNLMTTRYTPGPIAGYVDTVASGDHVCGMNGTTLYCWGYNNLGQVGDGTQVNKLTAAPVTGAGATSQVATGSQHTCSITTTNTAYCWGRNYLGELGIGNFTPSYSTTPLAVTSTVTGPMAQIDAGNNHTCAVATDSKLYCWGYNAGGQLGQGDRTIRPAPTRVGTGLWLEVAAGDEHTCAVAMDTSLWCWGRNQRGQLGIGSFTDRLVPALVDAEGGWSDVVTGYNHTCARKTDGETWCWGVNDFGQIPDGSAWRTAPVMVP